MGRVWTLQDWNNIIQQVNDLAQNPDPGCDPVSPLESVDPPHKWSKADIQQVQDKLKEICKDNTFSAELRLWAQNIIDEINDAIAKGWCGCNMCQAEDETYIIFDYSVPCNVHIEPWDCGQSDPCYPPPQGSYFDYYSAAAGITGFGPSIGGGYSIVRTEWRDDEPIYTSFCYSNTFDCAGNQTLPMPPPVYIGGELKNSAYGPIDHCFSCALYRWSCFLWWCSCGTCVVGSLPCRFPPPASDDQNCDASPNGTYEQNVPEYALAVEDCSHTHRITFEVRKHCNEGFHTGAPCRKCCSDGVHFCDNLSCPGDPACE
jgi:hypothetical protein